MEKTTICVLLLLCALVLVWSFSCLIKAIFNFKAAKRAVKHSDRGFFSNGMVINRKTKKVEEDSSPILPF